MKTSHNKMTTANINKHNAGILIFKQLVNPKSKSALFLICSFKTIILITMPITAMIPGKKKVHFLPLLIKMKV